MLYEKIMKHENKVKTITITACNRPKYFESMVRSLLMNDLTDWKIYIQIEPGIHDEFIEICTHLLKGIHYQVIVNSECLGIRANPYQLLSRVFEEGSDLNIYLEEDIIVGTDITQLADWYFQLQERDENLLCLNLIFSHIQSAGILSDKSQCMSFLKTHAFNSLGFVCGKRQWFQVLKPQWNLDPKKGISYDGLPLIGWDLSLAYFIAATPNYYNIAPVFARANHIGRAKGQYCTLDFHDRAFDAIPIFVGGKVEGYRIITPEELPRSSRSFVYLHEEFMVAWRMLNTRERQI